MGFTHDLALRALRSIPQYATEFRRAFGTADMDIDRVTTAIAAFEETLVTPNARFDRWLTGNKSALTPRELAGYQTFKSSGCTACHTGPAGRQLRQFEGGWSPVSDGTPRPRPFEKTPPTSW